MSSKRNNSISSKSSRATMDDAESGMGIGHADDHDEQSRFLTLKPLEQEQSNQHKHHAAHGISDLETAASLMKAIMGAGSFALPWAFSQMGYWVGPIGMSALMLLSIYSLKLLIQCKGIRNNVNDMNHNNTTYVDIAKASFGTIGAQMTYVASISASVGVCGSYLVFVSANLQSLLLSDDTTIRQGIIIFLIAPIAMWLSSIRDMKKFAFALMLGDISVVLGMVVVVIYGFLYKSVSCNECQAVGSIDTMPLALGAIGYLFLVHFLSLPIESSMANPQNFEKVATLTFLACAIISGSFGVLGYFFFGAATKQIILLNVRGSLFVSAVKWLLCIDLLLTYPVVMRPSIVIIEQGIRQQNTAYHSIQYLHAFVCISLGVVAASAGAFIPAFGLLSGLVGGVSQTFLAFVLPPMMLSKLQTSSAYNVPPHQVVVVLLGAILIVWTLHSTWLELNNS